MEGSSPLARGLRVLVLALLGLAGIIPARAGFTPPGRWTPGRMRDHPRSRGVYGGAGGRFPLCTGSSPLARGLRHALHALRIIGGIIPARAGFTGWSGGRSRPPGDHPRSRGVYPLHPVGGGDPPGSSPLARGLPDIGVSINGWSGIIPARAGFTSAGVRTSPPPWDHPRSRGVYHPLRPAADNVSGSSPLARGLRTGRRGHR